MLESPAISARTLLGVQGPGRFLGELDLLTGQASFTTAVVREPGEVLAVPVDRLRQVVSSEPSLSDLLLRACLFRRSMLIGLGSGLRIIGSRHSPASRRLRDFAARNRLPHIGSTSRRTGQRNLSCASSGSHRKKRRSSSGAGSKCCVTPATRSSRGRSACGRGPRRRMSSISWSLRGAGRPRRRRLRRVGGPAHDRARRRRHRRLGRHRVANRELPRIPD
jgi:hypothetical protein